jgi:hypothetical protein
MPTDNRLGVAGLIVAFFSMAAFYLWPEEKWIGWLSLFLAAALGGIWLFLEIKPWTHKHPAAIPVMFVAVVNIFAAIAGHYVKPASAVAPVSPGRKVAAETLWEMFNHDFPGTSNWSFPWNYAETDKSTFLITVNLYLDRSANAKFVAFYVSHSKYSYVTSLAFASDVYSAISDVERRFNVTQHTPGQTGFVSEKDLVFSKRIFLYAEDDFSAEQIGNLSGYYKEKGFDLQIRSNDYVMLRNYQKANP